MTQFGLWATDDGSVGPDDDLLHAQLTGLGGPLVTTTPVSSPQHAACDVKLFLPHKILHNYSLSLSSYLEVVTVGIITLHVTG